MKPRAFNHTGLTVTPIGLGLAALGRPGYINLGHAADLNKVYDVEAMERHAHAVLDAAWDYGIRYFDAARSYGRAEAFLSTWLSSRAIDPIECVVGSKWGYTYTAGWQVDAAKHEVKDHSLPVFERQIHESQTCLGKYLKIYQVHSATLDSGVLDNPDVLNAMGKLRDNGVIIGLSLSGPGQGETLLKSLGVQIDGKPLFQSVQATWNLLSREVGPALAEAHDAGMGVIVKEAVANGRLTDRNNLPAFSPKRKLLQEVTAEAGVSIDALAIAGVLARPWVDVVLSGAAQTAHLVSNIQAQNVVWNEEIEDRLSGLTEPAEMYWQTRSGLVWN